jgi:nitrate/nitrite transport system ATP-binding protein
MMTNGPAATIGEIMDVRLARPRERVALAHDALYNEYRTHVLEFLYHRQARPAKEAA